MSAATRSPSPAIAGRMASSSPMQGEATFTLQHRVFRLIWQMTWLLLAAWTPSFLWRWRGLILRAFGASIHKTAIVRASARIWWPGNLIMDAHSSLGPGVICYNVAPITFSPYAIVSQGAHLCTAGHDIDRHDFPLTAAPITLGPSAWIAAEAFVGPGVKVAEGAVLGARAVSFRDLDPWMVYAGNPAKPVRPRRKASETAQAHC
ncbi:putative colanic acid biosynthesis acetyltransferase [Ochrobactrum quorumnocens]|uniref:Putative colanic acid biosynthesis acetyltransferase n=1 Tax=Ochrobactrum quorumnocens TaxID=271865 RepID=A0A5N1JY99_9HYPH|nr:putative colanic acid biosynthesis acetyltransferase [[Ochrobactrum] quorumnocens]KAA9367241.1 putative colanic acid biosynthesis acetyltransferase [[Ochrobactrum] quorumnocens]